MERIIKGVLMMSMLQGLDRDDGAFVLLGRLSDYMQQISEQDFHASEKYALMSGLIEFLRENSQMRSFFVSRECIVSCIKEKTKKGKLRCHSYKLIER